MVMIIGKNNTPIATLQQWQNLGGPQSSKQWRDGRSAKECAQAWLRTASPAVPAELDALFATHPLTSGMTVHTARPEVETKLDKFRGNGRFHDLVLEGDASGGKGRFHDLVLEGHAEADGKVVVCVEAKADEPFGNYTVLRAEQKAMTANPGSKVGQRIALLKAALFPPGTNVDKLRYQLMYAVAGTLIEAKKRGAEVAVFVVHEFAFPQHVKAKKLTRNADELDKLCKALGVARLQRGVLIHVPTVPGGKFVPSGMTLLMGKVRYP